VQRWIVRHCCYRNLVLGDPRGSGSHGAPEPTFGSGPSIGDIYQAESCSADGSAWSEFTSSASARRCRGELPRTSHSRLNSPAPLSEHANTAERGVAEIQRWIGDHQLSCCRLQRSHLHVVPREPRAFRAGVRKRTAFSQLRNSSPTRRSQRLRCIGFARLEVVSPGRRVEVNGLGAWRRISSAALLFSFRSSA
jgi:hypothetical protein